MHFVDLTKAQAIISQPTLRTISEETTSIADMIEKTVNSDNIDYSHSTLRLLSNIIDSYIIDNNIPDYFTNLSTQIKFSEQISSHTQEINIYDLYNILWIASAYLSIQPIDIPSSIGNTTINNASIRSEWKKIINLQRHRSNVRDYIERRIQQLREENVVIPSSIFGRIASFCRSYRADEERKYSRTIRIFSIPVTAITFRLLVAEGRDMIDNFEKEILSSSIDICDLIYLSDYLKKWLDSASDITVEYRSVYNNDRFTFMNEESRIRFIVSAYSIFQSTRSIRILQSLTNILSVEDNEYLRTLSTKVAEYTGASVLDRLESDSNLVISLVEHIACTAIYFARIDDSLKRHVSNAVVNIEHIEKNFIANLSDFIHKISNLKFYAVLPVEILAISSASKTEYTPALDRILLSIIHADFRSIAFNLPVDSKIKDLMLQTNIAIKSAITTRFDIPILSD